MLGGAVAALGRVIAGASLVDGLLLLGAVLLALYVAGTWTYDHFARLDRPYVRPTLPFFGNLGPAIVGLKSVPDLVKELYDRTAGEPVVGIFFFTKPQYMVRDPEVLRQIAVKKFDHFTNHPPIAPEAVEPEFGKNLLNLRDQRWRDMRTTLSPAFTASKLKNMFGLIDECGRQLVQHIARKYKEEGSSRPMEIDVKQLFTRFTNDVIATVAFGLRCDSLKEPDDLFYSMGRRLAHFRMWAFGLLKFAPRVAKILGVTMGDPTSTQFFSRLLHDTIRERQEQNISRPDMLRLLMQARHGELKAEEEDENESLSRAGGKKMNLTDMDITAQAFNFFFAGFDTVSTALCFVAYALAAHPHVQRRLQHEVDDAWRRLPPAGGGGGRFTYERVAALKYLDMVVSETLRLYPPASAVDRECSSPCTVELPNGRPPIHFQAKDQVWVPVHGLHRDPQYWPQPEKFDPERFSEENKSSVVPFTYLPFGVGPRMCIGQRFALLELKVAVLHLVSRFELLPGERTPVPIAYKRGGGFAFTPAGGGFVFALRPRQECPAATPPE